jgi:hypothetical protein
LSPFFNKLAALGEHNQPLLIVPNIVFNREKGTISFPDANNILPVLMDSKDLLPMISDYSGTIKTFDEDSVNRLKVSWLFAAGQSLYLAGAVAEKDPRIKIKLAPKPKPSDDSIVIKMGKAPRRKASVVVVDPNPIQKSLVTDETLSNLVIDSDKLIPA